MVLGFREEFNNTGLHRVKRVVACAPDVLSRRIFSAALADDNLADRDFLAVLNFNAEAL